MIRNTFSIVSGVGEKTEKSLWSKGILTWDDFLSSHDADGLSPSKKLHCNDFITEAAERLKNGDAKYFKENLKTSEHWRMFDLFRDDVVCLDIESNGLAAGAGGYPTVVGLYGRGEFKAFVRGKDLTLKNVMNAMKGYKCLITFYGSVFDVPFLERMMPGFKVDYPHFDLCFGFKKVGIEGGLKSVEIKLGIERPAETVGMDGYKAVLLWQRARRGDKDSLDLLIKYNREDTVNLLELAEIAYPKLVASTGIGRYL